jgi:protein-disulfide isomerase
MKTTSIVAAIPPLILLMTACPESAPGAVVEGNPESAVRVVIYENLQCSDCAVFRKMMDDHLLPRYGSKVAFEHRDFPLPRHAWARPAAVAARFFDAEKPGLGVEFRRHIMASQKQITVENIEGRVKEYASRHGVDEEKATAALKDPTLAAAIDRDYQQGVARGVSKTPTVFVNGAPFVETFTLEQISAGIDAALREAGQ